MTKIKKLNKIEKENKQLTYKKIESQLDLLVKGQEINREELQLGFIGLFQKNQELVELNKKLNDQLEIVVAELNQIKQERTEKEIRKQTRANRKRLPSRDPMTAEI